MTLITSFLRSIETLKSNQSITYRYLTNEYRIYTCKNGRKYKVFRNGMVIACAFELVDKLKRVRHYEEKKCNPTVSNTGYFEIFLGGRKGELWLLHRLVATCWLGKSNCKTVIEHINSNKSDNCVENLRWLTQEEYNEKYANYVNGFKEE